MYEIEEYLDEDGRSPFAEWLTGLKDRRARMRLLVRLDRVGLGNLGDWRSLAGGIAELRDPHGPGYRVYFHLAGPQIAGPQIILLLGGSTKRDQSQAIVQAGERLADYRRRTKA